MSKKIFRFVFIVGSVLYITSASATCLQMGPEVSDALDYLICLHNQQATELNDQRSMIKKLSSFAILAEDNGGEAARRIDKLERTVSDLQDEIRNLEQSR
jgi:hypothetical protein